MYKPGIWSIEQLHREVENPSGRRVRQAAITLLDELPAGDLGERMRERIFLELADDRGAYKRTYKNRFDAFDDGVIEAIARHHSGDQPLAVLDCGISDGRTAVDLFTKLAARFPNVSYHGTDYDPSVRVVEVDGATFVFSSKGDPVQIVRAPFVLNLKVPDRWRSNPVNRLALAWYRATRMDRARAALSRNSGIREISLFCTAAKRLAGEDTRFTLGRYDVLDPPERQYDVIRMMNLLNPTYFSPAEFQRIIAGVRDALTEHGVFVVGSNQDAGTSVAGAIYVKENGTLTELDDHDIDRTLREMVLTA